MPGGKMKVSCERDMKCAGYEHAGTICIKYSIPQGVQKPYHPNPGAPFSSAKRTAYLPETADGCDLLKRLKYAFMHGLTFTVGVSQATGLDDSVTWSTIPHKTSMTGGPFGYPDPAYFAACHKELDNLEVPKAADL
jgi:deltex